MGFHAACHVQSLQSVENLSNPRPADARVSRVTKQMLSKTPFGFWQFQRDRAQGGANVGEFYAVGSGCCGRGIGGCSCLCFYFQRLIFLVANKTILVMSS